MLQFTPVHPCNVCLLQDFPPIKLAKRLLLINTEQTKNPRRRGKWDGFDFPHSPRLYDVRRPKNQITKSRLLLQPLKSNRAVPSQWINLPALNNKQPSAFPNRSLLPQLPAKCRSKSKREGTKLPCNDFVLKIDFKILDLICKSISIGKKMQA